MRRFGITVDIEAAPEQVWAVMSDFERWPQWTPTVTSIRQLGTGPVVPGTRLLIRQPKFPPAVWKLTQIEPGTRFVWTTAGPGVRVVADHSVVPVPTGSRVTLSLDFQGVLGGMIGRISKGLNHRYLGLEAAGLKKRCEGKA